MNTTEHTRIATIDDRTRTLIGLNEEPLASGVDTGYNVNAVAGDTYGFSADIHVFFAEIQGSFAHIYGSLADIEGLSGIYKELWRI